LKKNPNSNHHNIFDNIIMKSIRSLVMKSKQRCIPPSILSASDITKSPPSERSGDLLDCSHQTLKTHYCLDDSNPSMYTIGSGSGHHHRHTRDNSVSMTSHDDNDNSDELVVVDYDNDNISSLKRQDTEEMMSSLEFGVVDSPRTMTTTTTKQPEHQESDRTAVTQGTQDDDDEDDDDGQEEKIAFDHTSATAVPSTTTQQTSVSSSPPVVKERVVTWGQLQIHEHVIALGIGAIPSCGPPITMEPKSQAYYEIPIEEYEQHRPHHPRKGTQMLRSKRERTQV
jgi:hypothetical protein